MITPCNRLRTDKIISVSENKRTFKINNKSLLSINQVKVDGCFITSGNKCDFLFEIITNKVEKVFYVELKGRHIEDAIKQLEATLIHCKPYHGAITKESYIIASKVPKASTSTQKLKKEFKRKNASQLFIDTTLREVHL
ncbi:MAG TPA: hypothetical protein ENK91_06165 [Bacteroidetes bacterium]|nr:hypothetical protein [Bacteroidota bacterium]